MSSSVASLAISDQRLTKLATKLAEALGRNPILSVPSAVDSSRAEIEACYRFFDNENVTPKKRLQPHIEATYKRIDQLSFVLFAQDTSEIDLTRPEQQVQGAGAMDCESRRGLFYHPMIAFDQAGVS